MNPEIRNRFTDEIIVEAGKYETVREAVESNRANLNEANLDGANLVEASLYGANLVGANLNGASLYGANLDGASLYGANLVGANLNGANLVEASLDGANLYGASLYGASLYGASLYGASLYEASLNGAKGVKFPIISITGSCHNVQYMDGNITIGCEHHSVEYWRIAYDIIGRENDYTPEQIAEYKSYIDMITACMRI